VILIGGVGRIGKTRLAKKLTRRTGFDLIHCDKFRRAFWSIADEQSRSAERFWSYEQAIANRCRGLIIEGDDLISRNRGDDALAKMGLIGNDNRLSLVLVGGA
jgi:hypothetical protein